MVHMDLCQLRCQSRSIVECKNFAWFNQILWGRIGKTEFWACHRTKIQPERWPFSGLPGKSLKEMCVASEQEETGKLPILRSKKRKFVRYGCHTTVKGNALWSSFRELYSLAKSLYSSLLIAL